MRFGHDMIAASTHRGRFVLVAVAALAAGCGGGAAPAAQPKSATSYHDVADAEDDLRSAESRTAAPATGAAAPTTGRAAPGQAGGGEGRPAATTPPPAAAAEKSDATEREAPKKEAAPTAPAEQQAQPQAPSPCAVACRALASMRRAADAICRIAGPDDPRCTDAKHRVDQGAARAESCRCDARTE